MARRSDADEVLDNLQAAFRQVPWWVGPPVILVTWVVFGFLIPALLATEVASAPQSMLITISTIVAPWLALLVGGVWVTALFQKLTSARRLDRQTGIDSIRQLPWREFEQLLGEAFRRQGYQVSTTPAGADGGIDLILRRGGQTTIVQAKQWRTQRVGVKPVRELAGVQVTGKTAKAIFVTSGSYTAEARSFADQARIQLIDGPALATMIASVRRGAAGKPATASKATPVAAPTCPSCGAAMVERIARKGTKAGERFWGCSTFPKCRGTRAVD